MVQLQDKSIIEPSLADVLTNTKRDIFSTFNCVKIGQVVSFDTAKKTAQVQILFKRVVADAGSADGRGIQSYPVLVDVPVFTLQGGGGAIQFPIQAGDQCILLFSDRRIDEWFQNGAEAAPADGRMHDMSDGIALVGVNALNSGLMTYPTDKVVLSYLGSRFELTATGWNFVGTGSAEIDLAGAIVTIKNSTTSLLVVLNGLIDVIKTLQVTGPLPLTPAAIAALEAYKLVLATLLA